MKALMETDTCLPFAVLLPDAFLDRRQDHFLQVADAMKWMRMESIAKLAGKFCQTRIHARDVNGNGLLSQGRGKWSGIEEWGHECNLVILAAIIQLCPVLPAIPKCSYDFNLFSQLAGHGLRPGLAKPALNMRLDLGAKPKDESVRLIGRPGPRRCTPGWRGSGQRKRRSPSRS